MIRVLLKTRNSKKWKQRLKLIFLTWWIQIKRRLRAGSDGLSGLSVSLRIYDSIHKRLISRSQLSYVNTWPPRSRTLKKFMRTSSSWSAMAPFWKTTLRSSRTPWRSLMSSCRSLAPSSSGRSENLMQATLIWPRSSKRQKRIEWISTTGKSASCRTGFSVSRMT